MSKKWDRLVSLVLVRQPVYEKENSEFKPTAHNSNVKKALCHTLAWWDAEQIPALQSWRTSVIPLCFDTVGRVSWYTDQVGCVLAFVLVTVGQGRLTLVLEKPSTRVTWPWLTLFGRQGAVLSGNVWFIALCPRRTFLEEGRRGPRHFWNHRGCLGNCFAPDPDVKNTLCHTLAWWDAEQTPALQ